jgi:hypothetical protein
MVWASSWGAAGVVLWRGRGCTRSVYETHPCKAFRERTMVNQFLELAHATGALDAEQLLSYSSIIASLLTRFCVTACTKHCA